MLFFPFSFKNCSDFSDIILIILENSNLRLSKVSSVQRRQPQRRGPGVGPYFLTLGLGASDTLVTSILRG